MPVLTGAVRRIRESIGSSHQGYSYYRPDPDLEERATAEARSRLGNDRFDDGVDSGRAMSIDEAVAFAVAGITHAN